MLSRVADSIYWMNRYIERAENYARFIDVNFNLTLDLPYGMTEQWRPLLFTTADHKLFEHRYGGASKENVIRFLTFDLENSNSILSCLSKARENARTMRDVISTEMWEQLNTFYLSIRNSKATNVWNLTNQMNFFHEIRRGCALFYGIADSTIMHSESWHFGNLGRYMERADKTTRILDMKYYILLPKVEDVGSPIDLVQWTAVLKSASALEMYRQSVGRLIPTEIAKFLILDREFPRSIRFCVAHAANSLNHISGSNDRSYSNVAEKKVGHLRSDLDYIDMQEIFHSGLHEFLDEIQVRLNETHNAVHETFFTLQMEPSHAFVEE